MGQNKGFLNKSLCLLIRFYQRMISPFIKPCCRFYPSCSQYTLMALRQYGIAKGLWMGLKRILRCHPWSLGGYDPVLPNDEMQ